MFHDIKAFSNINRTDWYVVLGGPLVTFMLLQLIINGVMIIVQPDESIFISCILLTMTCGVSCFAVVQGNFSINFPLLLRFGVTRRRALCLVGGTTGLMALSSALLSSLLMLCERTVAMPVWRFLSGNPELLVDDFGYFWWAIPLGALAGYVLGLFGATLVTRFGGKGQIVGAVLYFGSLWGFQALPWKTHEVTNILIPALVAAVILTAVWSVWTLLRLSITK